MPPVSRLRLGSPGSSPWRFDAEAGVMPWQRDYTYSSSFRDARPGRVTDGATCQLTSHLSLTADARVSWSVFYSLFGQLLHSRHLAPLQLACSVGAAYSFRGPPR